MKKLNKDQKRRDEILFGVDPSKIKYLGGCAHYENVTLEIMKQLIEEGFVDLEETQNDSPTIKEFVEFVEKYPDSFTFHGYVVSDKRDDYRLSVEGIEGRFSTQSYKMSGFQEFVDMFRNADDFGADYENNSFYCWYD